MRIAHVTAVYPPYAAGGGIACFYQAAELAARGHDVSVWTVAQDEAPPPSGAQLHALPASLQLGAAPLLPGLWRLPEVDVIHLHHPFIFGVEPVLAAAIRRPRTALVVSYHNRLVGSGLRRPLFWVYEETLGRALARRADRLVVLSPAHGDTVDYLRTARRRSPERLASVPNGVDARRFSPGTSPELRRRLGIPADAVVVVHTATLDRTHFLKRTDLALAAFGKLDDPNTHLLVIGDGEWREQLEAQAPPRSHFIGHRNHDVLADALRAGDIFLLSSDLDSFGLVLLEALACGVPAVATDPPGVRAMAAGSEAVTLVGVRDVDAMAGALDGLVRTGTEERARLGEAARKLVEDRYSLEAVVDSLEDVYAAAIARRRGSPPSS